MKYIFKILLSATITTMAFSSTANARDNLFLGSDTGINARFQQQRRKAARIGFAYSFKFGGKKTKQNKYGTLNLQSFAGRKIPIMNFGVKGISPTSNLVKLSAYGDGAGGVSMTIILITTVVAGLGLLVLMEKDDNL